MYDLDRPDDRLYPADEVTMLLGWPDGALEVFVAAGLLTEVATPGPVWLADCVEPDWADPEWLLDTGSGRIRGYCPCPYEFCGGRHVVERERGRQWRPTLAGVTDTVARAIDGQPVEVVPERVLLVGSMVRDGVFREIFLVRGAAWPDAEQVVAHADRLKRSPAPAVLAVGALPPPDAWRGLKPAVMSLAETATVRGGKVCVDLTRLFLQPTVPHPDAGAPRWLSVTEAAELLMKDLPSLSLENARARVSAAAGRRSFGTNGMTRDKRRIDRDSFSTWRLAQRDKDLDAEDEDEDG
jgi:hypothetical protein